MNGTDSPDGRLTIAHYFLFLLLFVSLFTCYRMIRPYLDPVIMALILAGLSGPVYRWLEKKTRGRTNLAALLCCIILTLVIVVPFMIMLSVIISQGIDSFEAINRWLAEGNLQRLAQTPLVTTVIGMLHRYLPDEVLKDLSIQGLAFRLSSAAGKALVSQSGRLIGNISIIVGKFFLMIFVFFFALKDGEKIYSYVLHISPLSKKQEDILVEKIKDVAKSAILGSLVTAVAQGAAGGIAFAICGLPGFFWGAAMAFSSLVPVVGTALVWGPAAVYLFLSGSTGLSIFMLVWCIAVVGAIDNFLRPVFMKGGAGMSTVVIFFAILGGIHHFGLSGLIYGPLVFGITMVLLYCYDLEFRSFLKKQDSAS